MAGIIHFSSFFQYMEEAEHAFLRSLGVSVVQKQPDGSTIGWPRVHAECSFEAPAYFEDMLTVRLTVTRKGAKSLTYAFEFFRDETRIARGQLKAACCICDPGQPLRAIEIPEELAAKIEPNS